MVSLGFAEVDITDNAITKKVDLFGQKGLPFLKKPSTFLKKELPSSEYIQLYASSG